MDYVLELIEEKMEIKVPAGEIQAAHFLPGGNMLIRFWNHTSKSAFGALVDKIKSGKGRKDIPIFLNFQLSRRRSTILFLLRGLKREGKISKFYSDENGSIAIRVREGSQKVKLTNFPAQRNTPGSPLRTVKDRMEIMELAGIEEGSDWTQ